MRQRRGGPLANGRGTESVDRYGPEREHDNVG
jgi:hypothetical protein